MSVEILMAAYNGERFIAKQLDSLLEQTYKNWHLTVCDDHSADSTPDILNKYQSLYPDKITVLQNEINKGIKDNFFDLLKTADADYIMFCDQDDIWLKNKIELTLDCMRQNEGNKPLLVHTDLSIIDADDNIAAPSMVRLQALDTKNTGLERLLVQNCVTGCTAMINRRLADIIKKPACPTLHDWWSAITAVLFGRIVFLPESTILYRRHDANVRGARDMASAKYILSRAKDKRDAKNMLRLGYEQSAELAELYGADISPGQFELLKAYGSCTKYGKLKRLAVVCKYGIWKKGLIRKIGQIVYL